MNRVFIAVYVGMLVGLPLGPVAVAREKSLRPSQQTAIADVDRRSDDLKAVNQAIWHFAEVGLEERKSCALLVETLNAAGFDVKTDVSGMPTAFVAGYGSGRPIIGILAEYDALPGMSQKVVLPRRHASRRGNQF